MDPALSGLDSVARSGRVIAMGTDHKHTVATYGQAEEAIRAQSVAEIRRLIDTFIETVKENVHDEETRDRIRQAILDALPEEESAGTGESDNPLVRSPAG